MGLAFGLLKQALPLLPRSVPNAEKQLAMLAGEEILIFPNLRDAGLRQSAAIAEESPVRWACGSDVTSGRVRKKVESAQGSQRPSLRKAR